MWALFFIIYSYDQKNNHIYNPANNIYLAPDNQL